MRRFELLATTINRPVSAIFTVTIALGACVRPAHAADPQPSVETLVVTAERRPENIQDVPMSVSAVSGAILEQNNIVTVADLSRFMPGVLINTATSNRNSSIAIRNVGTAGTNPGVDQDVGVFIDGVYMPVAGPVYSELTDIATVEVLRGPQGTLYGRNTPVGAINITTRAPTDKTEGMVDVEAGNYGQVRVTGYFGGPIADNLAGRISAWTDSESGYLHNIYDNTDVFALSQYGARGRLRWTPDGDTTVDLIGYYSYSNNDTNSAVQVDPLGPGGIVFGYNPTPKSFATSPFVIAQKATNPTHPYVVPGPWEVDSADLAINKTQIYAISAQASRNLSSIDATVLDILAYNSYFDFTPNQGPGGLPLDLADNQQRDLISSTSNEVRIVSNGRHFLNYVGGFYAYYGETSYTGVVTTGTQANRVFPAATGGGGIVPAGNGQVMHYKQNSTSLALYGQITLDITDSFRLTGGGRYSDDFKKGDLVASVFNSTGGPISPVFLASTGSGGSISGRRRDDAETWTLGAQYDIQTGVMAYVTAGSGFKDGGFNSRSITAVPFSFGPETSLTYEAGIKSTLFDHRLLLNADVFRMLVHDYQQSTLAPGGTGFVIGPAGDFRNQGVELDAQATPIAPLSITASASYIKSLITGGANELACDTTYPFAGSPPPTTSGQFTDATHKFCNFNGLQLGYAPVWRSSLGARWEQPFRDTSFRWFVSGDVSYQSSEYMDASLDPRSFQDGYALFDALLGLESDSHTWRVNLWGKNLGDKRYFVTESAQTQAGNASAGGTAAVNGFIGHLGIPRTFGIEASYRF